MCSLCCLNAKIHGALQRQGMLREMAHERKIAHDMQHKYEGVILGIKAKAAEQVQFFSAQMQAMEAARQQELKQKQEEMRSTYEQKLKLLEQQIQLLSENKASEHSRREAEVLARVEDERRRWQAKEMQHQQEINNLRKWLSSRWRTRMPCWLVGC